MTARAEILVCDASIAQAQRVARCLSGIAADIDLQIPDVDRHGYHPADIHGVSILRTDAADQVRAPVLGMHAERRRRQREDMARHPDRAYMHETVPIIWVVLQELALGVPKVLAETTMEVWLKERLERARGRRPIETDREEEQREPVSGFQAALEAVGFVCLEEPVLARRGPIFVHIRDYGVTFLPEPNLPKKALLEATRLLLEDERRAKAAASDRPLRWDLRKERWRPLPEDWASEDGEKRLVAEWRQLIAASRPS